MMTDRVIFTNKAGRILQEEISLCYFISLDACMQLDYDEAAFREDREQLRVILGQLLEGEKTAQKEYKKILNEGLKSLGLSPDEAVEVPAEKHPQRSTVDIPLLIVILQTIAA